jgi:hypothetical protein
LENIFDTMPNKKIIVIFMNGFFSSFLIKKKKIIYKKQKNSFLIKKKKIIYKKQKKVVLEHFYINVELKPFSAHQAKGHLSIQYHMSSVIIKFFTF